MYEGIWEGTPLNEADCVLSTDEKTSIQARRRKHPTSPTEPGRPMRVEHEYERKGAWAYLAAWDVRRAKIFGRCEETHRHCSLQRLGRACDGPGTLSVGASGVLDYGQQFLPSRRAE
ncbi:MAG: hypothetical protein ABSH28_23645 [Acidobacteriota bacterium]